MIWGAGFGVQVLECRVGGAGFEAHDLGCRNCDVESGVQN